MSSINPYSNVAIQPTKSTAPTQRVEKTEPTEKLSREDIISSKDLTPTQKMDMLGIKPMSVNELSEALAKKFLDDE
jgi:hypothetical protein